MFISRNVVILGKVGSGKRTLGNHIVGRDVFERQTTLGKGNVGGLYGEVKRGDTFYRILTVDTGSLRTGYDNPVLYIQHKFQEINLIIFVVPHGRNTDECHGSLTHAVESLTQQAKPVSTLVITHCEEMTDEQREAIIAEFRDNARSSQVLDFVHGIHAVGFPPNVNPILQDAICRDEEAIRKLVGRCKVPLSAKRLPRLGTKQSFLDFRFSAAAALQTSERQLESQSRSLILSSSRNIVILGKVGSGKRTLGNHIVGRDIFQLGTALSTGNVGAHYGEVRIGDTFYRILTVDTESLQTGYNNPIPDIQQKFQEIHSIIFAIPHGRYTDESHWSLMHAVESLHHQAKSVSALVITHCEGMTDEQREAIIAEFRADARSSQVVAFVQHGTHMVGFPDLSTLPPTVKAILQNAIDRDEEAIRKLVERCKVPLSVKSLPGIGTQQPFDRPSATKAMERQARRLWPKGI